MAKIEKFDTIEAAAEALGVLEINDANRPHLKSLVKSDRPEAGKIKKELVDKVAQLGIEGLDMDKENADSLKVRIIGHLFANGDMPAVDAFAAQYNLVVDHETGRVYRSKQPVKPITQRNAGGTEGTVGNLSIKILQDERYADKTIPELVELFPAFCAELGYADKKTTVPSLSWYVTFCKAHNIEFIERRKQVKPKTVDGSGKILGAELNLEKCLAPKSFKKTAPADTGSELDLDSGAPGAEEEMQIPA